MSSIIPSLYPTLSPTLSPSVIDHSLGTGPILAIVFFGVAFLVTILIVYICCCRNKKTLFHTPVHLESSDMRSENLDKADSVMPF